MNIIDHNSPFLRLHIQVGQIVHRNLAGWEHLTCQRILHILSSTSGNWSDWSGVCPVVVLGATGRHNNTKRPEKKIFFFFVEIPNYVTPSTSDRSMRSHTLIITFISVDQYELQDLHISN